MAVVIVIIIATTHRGPHVSEQAVVSLQKEKNLEISNRIIVHTYTYVHFIRTYSYIVFTAGKVTIGK